MDGEAGRLNVQFETEGSKEVLEEEAACSGDCVAKVAVA